MRCTGDRIGVALGLVLALSACKDEGDASAEGETGDASTDDTTGDGSGDESGGSTGGPVEWASLEERPCPEDSFLTFENFGAIHLLNYCTGCHASGLPADQRQGAPIEINFDDLQDVRAQAARIWARAADANTTMPPAGGAPADERALLGEWLACGALTDADAAGADAAGQ